MMNIFFILYVLISIFIIVLVSWYCKSLISRIDEIYTDFRNFSTVIKEFEGHLDILLSAEILTGEPVVENLLKHTKMVKNEMNKYSEVFLFLVGEEEEEEEEQDEE